LLALYAGFLIAMGGPYTCAVEAHRKLRGNGKHVMLDGY
jgi:hypothetical protein